MKIIPLHSLVILVGPAAGGKTHQANRFPSHDVVGSEAIRVDLVGDANRQEVNDVVFRELYRRVGLKLEMGERVVVDALNLRRRDRVGLAEIATRLALPVFYMVCDRPLQDKLDSQGDSWRRDAQESIEKQDQLFKLNEREILRGDGVANIIDTRLEDYQIINKMPLQDVDQVIKDRGFRGLMVIGDVHGMIEPLKNATEWASQRNLFCVFLGDIIDYGPNPLECVDHVYGVITRGRGVSIIGNHERKIDRWLNQWSRGDAKLNLSEGNKVTTRIVERLGFEARRRFEVKYRTLMSLSRHHWIIADTLFTHAAAEPETFDIHDTRLPTKLENLALFGEVDPLKPMGDQGYPNRIYEWVNRIPSGRRVMVGHDIRSTVKPLYVKGTNGGEAYFMDTGCGKGGRLTSADAHFASAGLLVKNFKYH